MSDKYNWDFRVETKDYEVCVDCVAKYGYFEHVRLGDERGGGLWFEPAEGGGLELTDQDGTPVLPRAVANILREAGFIVSEDFDY